MKFFQTKGVYPFLLIILIFFSGCRNDIDETNKPELLIYCGITMIHPMQEIASLIEKEQNCIIKITKQGSGSLLRSIQANGVGDLYLPGSESYIETALQEGLVTETVNVGQNRAALIVSKGNPLHITADINNLIEKK